jgi:hypothetical protein
MESPEQRVARLMALAESLGAPMSAKEKADWEFVCAYAHWDGERRKELNEATRKLLDRAVWAKQDGYGVAGYTPPQGWDWSGIRDSSPAGVRNMKAAIRRVLARSGR